MTKHADLFPEHIIPENMKLFFPEETSYQHNECPSFYSSEHELEILWCETKTHNYGWIIFDSEGVEIKHGDTWEEVITFLKDGFNLFRR